MTVSVVVPFSPGDPSRDRNWAWIRARYEHFHPDWELIEAPDPGPGPWSKGRAVNRGVDEAAGDMLVIADADIVIAPEPLTTATETAVTAPWVVPHGRVYRLAEPTTLELAIDRPPETVTPHDRLQRGCLVRRPYEGPAGGGLVVLRREAFETVGGIDERFLDWGGEDISFARALHTLVGPWVRIGAPVWHLWHPPQAGGRTRRANRTSEALAGRYKDSCGNPEAMRALIEEGRSCRSQPS